ncbi:MAG: enoyl-CoA hydratase-related protein [Alphaproteobacteria bacterium]|jgi:dihydroxynaphthoic acid synthetase|nr:enoyl-CoA hydratase-related protein [Alphaproteobacteria bacterium]
MSEEKFEDLLYETKDGVATITINRPDRLNALRGITMAELAAAIELAGHDKTVGVIVLTGAGERAFSAGGDVKWEKEGGLAERHMTVNPRGVHEAVRHSGKPVICVVKGYAIGMGNHLAYCCDMTIAADNAIFGQNGPRVGSPAEGWIISYATRVVGAKKAREMWMLCRRYSAQEALEMGICNMVVPLDELDEEVAKVCQEVLSLSPTCLRIVKASFDSDIDYLRDPAPNHFQMMIAPDYFSTEESKEGANAFLEKRKPDFMQFRR